MNIERNKIRCPDSGIPPEVATVPVIVQVWREASERVQYEQTLAEFFHRGRRVFPAHQPHRIAS